LDPKLQKKAIEAVEKQAKINDEEINAKNAALISIDNKNGQILSMV
jgi:membrane peptidoglycan carboxypeptidase